MTEDEIATSKGDAADVPTFDILAKFHKLLDTLYQLQHVFEAKLLASDVFYESS